MQRLLNTSSAALATFVVIPLCAAAPTDTHTMQSPAKDDGAVFSPQEQAPWLPFGGDSPSGRVAEQWLYPTFAPALSSPCLADVDGNGVKDIIVSTYLPGPNPYAGGWVYVIDVNGNDLPGWPIETDGPIPATPAVADVDNNGDMEVIVADWGVVHVWNHDGTYLPGWPKSNGDSQTAAVYDLDDDGDLEIISPDGSFLYIWHHDGTTMPGWPVSAPDSIGAPAVADIDGDGALEIAAATYAGPVGPDPYEVYVWELDGTVVPGWPVATSGVVKAPIALGDVDNDGQMEVVACAYHTSNNDYLYVWDAQGNLEPGWPQFPSYARLSGPALGDMDGDGDLEIVLGGWQTTPPVTEKIFAFHHDGTGVLNWPVVLEHPGGSGNVNSSAVIADIDGNPAQVEIIIKTIDHFFALHADGTPVFGFPYFLSDESHTGTTTPTPAVADCDDDGDVEYVFVSNFGVIAFFDELATYDAALSFWPMYKHDRLNTGALVSEGCAEDINGDGTIDVLDLLALLAAWGNAGGPEDVNGDGIVDVLDLLDVLAAWGPC